MSGDVIVKDREDVDIIKKYSGRWRILFFLFTGETFPSERIQSSEEECIRYGVEALNYFKGTTGLLGRENCETLGRDGTVDEVSHAIPMPIDGG